MSELVIKQNGMPLAGCTYQQFHATVTIPPRDPASMVAGNINGSPVMFVKLDAPPVPTPPAERGAEIIDRDHRVKLGESVTLRATASQPFAPKALAIADESGAADWIINDGLSWFLESGDIPGDMFANPVVMDAFLRSIESGLEVEVDASYIGLQAGGVCLRAALVCSGEVGLRAALVCS